MERLGHSVIQSEKCGLASRCRPNGIIFKRDLAARDALFWLTARLFRLPEAHARASAILVDDSTPAACVKQNPAGTMRYGGLSVPVPACSRPCPSVEHWRWDHVWHRWPYEIGSGEATVGAVRDRASSPS
jgi:hypothetical protein